MAKRSKKIIVKDKLAGSILLFTQSILFFAVGIFCLSNISGSVELFCVVISIFAMLAGTVFILSFAFIPRRRMASTLASGIAYIIFGLVIMLLPRLFLGFIVFFVGLWMLLNFTWRLVLCIQLKVNRDTGFVRALIDCIISIAFAVTIFALPKEAGIALYILLGIYLIMYGFTVLGDGVREILKWDLDGKHFKRRIKLRLPVLLTAFIPTKIFNKINKNLNDANTQEMQIVKKTTDEVSTVLEIFVHMSPKIAGGFGHIDICFKGTVYSYGTYDSDSVRLFGTVSDGVFVEMPRDKYIDRCINVDNETIVAFSLYLTDEQIDSMEKYLKKFKQNVYIWKSKKELNPMAEYSDPASRFYSEIDAKFYKFKKGKFKTYFAVKTNCVQMADTLVGASGIDVISLNGIITPGTYYKYLDDCFNRKNSFVVKKTVLSGAVPA
ncbi:MAG TPA: hypothetical protein GX401_00995 [Clostridiales bacterium]|nr:hypothetical protein [Clostridiales bacterium]